MKKLTTIVMLLLLLTSCTEKTKFGACVGLNGPREEHLIYEANTANLFLGIVFIETIIVPYFVLADEFYCPVGVK
jgi:hypothetical protein